MSDSGGAYIYIEDLDSLMTAFDRLGQAGQRHIEVALTEIYRTLADQLAQGEPSQASGVKYRRTGATANGWQTAATNFEAGGQGLSFTAGFENPVDHSAYVEDRQTLQDIIGRFRPGNGFSVWQGHTADDLIESASTESYIAQVLDRELDAAREEAGFDG